MTTDRPVAAGLSLLRATRDLFFREFDGLVLEMAATAQGRFTALAEQTGNVREQRARRDTLLDFQRLRDAWIKGVTHDWQRLGGQPGLAAMRRDDRRGQGLSLIGDDEIENGILVSRLVLLVEDKLSQEVNDLKLRIAQLEGGTEAVNQNGFQVDSLAALLVEHWTKCGLTRQSWMSVQDVLAPLLAQRMLAACQHANEFLIRQGVLPVIDRSQMVRRAPSGSGAAASRDAAALASDAAGRAGFAGGRGQDGGFISGAGTGFSSYGPGPAASGRGGTGTRSTGGGAPSTGGMAGHGHTRSALAEETRMLTATTPLARARQRAQGVLGQLRRLLTDKGAEVDATQPAALSPALVEALDRGATGRAAVGDTVAVSPDAAGVQQVAVALRERSTELKRKAASSSEKATIEIVALMFQAILAEERIPAGVRVWFARLQMPVLRVALAEPEFFGTLQHPARQLIDRMGSCVLGFDASGVQASAMEAEIRRVVQVIEQYPETGRRVFQLVLDEFQKFLSHFLTEKGTTRQLVSVAQQMEQKETLVIQYIIELRKMLDKMKVRDEIREFLFKVWAEALAVSALRNGPRHADTLVLKRTATDLLWAAGAKPNREDRARVIRELPQVLQRLRQGMQLLGLAANAQDAHIKCLSDILADAFMSKTEAIPQQQIDAMAHQLEQLEDALEGETTGDIELDPETLEVMLGIDASAFEVLANGASQPSPAMLAWARELELGHWFVLDHNSQVAQVQLIWRSDRRQLYLFASAAGVNYLIQARRLAAYLQAGLLAPTEDEPLTVRATREALSKLEANPERLLE